MAKNKEKKTTKKESWDGMPSRNWIEVELYLRVHGVLPGDTSNSEEVKKLELSRKELLQDVVETYKKALSMAKEGKLKSPTVDIKDMVTVAKICIKEYQEELANIKNTNNE